MKKVDVAMNIFGKPWNTALSLLSLVDKSGDKIDRIWLQFEPYGSQYDDLNPFYIVSYLRDKGYECILSQPENWLALQAADARLLQSPVERAAIRYEYAFENSSASWLALIHNDILVYKDLLGAMLDKIGDAFAIGHLGQCWNCPASQDSITKKILDCNHCTPDSYLDFRPDCNQLRALYAEAKTQGIFARPYDDENFNGEFETQSWPLPECRINEWACLLNMDMIKNLCIPIGDAWPPGAYRLCAGHTLDIGVAFFRDLHAKGLHARHMDLKPYMKHWVGTGKKTPLKYAKVEDNAKRIMHKHYPAFVEWTKKAATISGKQPPLP